MDKKMDRRIAKSRTAIEEAFLFLLEQEGFDALSVKRIAEQANVGRKTFYLHFEDLYALLNHVLDKEMAELATVCRQKEQPGFTDGAVLWFRYFEGKRRLFSALFASRKTVAFRDRLLALIMDDLQNKSLRSGVSMDEIDRHFFGMAVIGTIESVMSGSITADIERIARRVGTLLERNLRKEA